MPNLPREKWAVSLVVIPEGNLSGAIRAVSLRWTSSQKRRSLIFMTVHVRTNKSMLELLGGDPKSFELSLNELPPALLEKARIPLVELNGCVVPASNPEVTWVDDETGTECFWTKFHLEDFVLEPSIEKIARMALGFVWPLRAGIKASRLSGTFRMIASTELPSSAEEKPRCTIRFHRLRAQQAWLGDDLELYRTEAILACDFVVAQRPKRTRIG
jgi:hypothetical protein